MSRLNGRVSRLEAAAPPPADDSGRWLAELAADVIAAIDSGEIVRMADNPPPYPDWYHDETDFRPTTDGSLAGDERTRVRSLLYRADKIVVDVATQTGWRSPGGDKNRPYTFYHANSPQELRAVMEMVLDATAN